MASQSTEGLRIGHKRGHDLRLSGQGFEARARSERAEARIMNHQLERIGLHQFRNRRVAERHVTLADLRRYIALRRTDRTRTGASRRIDPPEPIRANTEHEHARGRQNQLTIVFCGNAICHCCPLD